MKIFLLIIFISFHSIAKDISLPEKLSIKDQITFEFEFWKYELENINFNDGVNYREAEIILRSLAFTEHAAGCGLIESAVDYGIYWKAGTLVGFAASKGAPILIHKKKAYISHGSKRIYAHASEMFK